MSGMRYWRKPVLVDAEQFDPGNAGIPSPVQSRWYCSTEETGHLCPHHRMAHLKITYLIETSEGSRRINPGDWIISVGGHLEICREAEFDRLYTVCAD